MKLLQKNYGMNIPKYQYYMDGVIYCLDKARKEVCENAEKKRHITSIIEDVDMVRKDHVRKERDARFFSSVRDLKEPKRVRSIRRRAVRILRKVRSERC